MVKKENLLYLHDFIPLTETEGPGKRACIWLQGCSICCEGCMAEHTWDRSKGEKITIEELYGKIKSIKEIEGITVLGGEPMEQADALVPFLKEVKNTGLSIMLFTGFYLNELITKSQKNIVDICDIIIDGPYIKDLTDFSRPWAGSTNQNIYFLSERYIHLKDNLEYFNNKIEVRISKDGDIKINGMLPEFLLNELRDQFEEID